MNIEHAVVLLEASLMQTLQHLPSATENGQPQRISSLAWWKMASEDVMLKSGTSRLHLRMPLGPLSMRDSNESQWDTAEGMQQILTEFSEKTDADMDL